MAYGKGYPAGTIVYTPFKLAKLKPSNILEWENDENNTAAHELVGVMSSLAPLPMQRDVKDFKQKLWDHLALMTNYKLDIEYPFPINRPETARKLDLPVYSTNRIARRHYGKITEELIKKAKEYISIFYDHSSQIIRQAKNIHF